jgi:hypothetical protein
MAVQEGRLLRSIEKDATLRNAIVDAVVANAKDMYVFSLAV